MNKLVLITFMILSTAAMAQSTNLPDFEAELRALETNRLQTEELQMRNADAVTDVISDDVSTGQAGVQKTELPNTLLDTQKAPESPKPVEADPARTRRIRSR